MPRVDLAVIVPTFNEAENIPELFERLFSSLKGLSYEIIVVDDSSPDETAKVVEEVSRGRSNVKVLLRSKKSGLTSAILEGVRFIDADVLAVAVMDADLQHPPELLPIMYSFILKGFDIVIASRYVKGGKIEDWRISRKLMSKLSILIVHLLFPKTRTVKDIVSGYFMIKKTILDNITVSSSGFKFLTEILIKVDENAKIIEIPYMFKKRKRGKSKLNCVEIVKFIKDILKLLIQTYLLFSLSICLLF